ncbi:hypothetical protein PRZ48_013614 [Zasmidium cellare]|uniref:Cupin 2 conserved barrel domain-containing protein n=1 Tax=Zasmidium cellare TaxID=395010 RepID=A0ABR0E1T0_ZASCE|nr:hypothetical protein PRZ48_013614 [Zasmidium cellare]
MSQSRGSAAKGLRPNKRYIATHDSTGKSVYTESPDQIFNAVPDVGGMARSYAIDSFPANLKDDADIKAYRAEQGVASHTERSIVVKPGANLVVVDLEPGGMSMMHRTVSIDFSICVVGEIDHELDSGEKVRLLPGDHIIQRGTMHRWSNPSKDKPARFVACTIPCVPFDIAGKPLEEVHVPNPRSSKL